MLSSQVDEVHHRVESVTARAQVFLVLGGLLGVGLLAGSSIPDGARLALGVGLIASSAIALASLLRLASLAQRTRELTHSMALSLEALCGTHLPQPAEAASGEAAAAGADGGEDPALARAMGVLARIRQELDRRDQVGRDLDRRVFEATTLNELMLKMSEGLRLDSSLKLALYSAMGVFGVTEGVLLMADEDGTDDGGSSGGVLVAATVRVVSESAPAAGARFPLDAARRQTLAGIAQPVSWDELASAGDPALADLASDLARWFGAFAPRLVCPLATHGRLLGFMLLGAKVSGEPFSPENLRFLETIAPAVALIIRNAGVLEKLELTNRQLDRRVLELTLLNEISHGLNVVGDLGQVMSTVLEHSIRGLECAAGVVHLLDPSSGTIARVAACGPYAPLAGPVPVPADAAPLGSVLSALRPLRVGPDHPYRPEDLGFADGPTLSSLLCVPMVLEKRPIGMVTVVNKAGGAEFSESDMTWLQTVARHAASVLENLRLFKLATEDGLTSLYVHRYFQIRLREELSRAARHARTVALVMVDIDHFKSVNDRHGHQAGDQVLREVAQIIRSTLREIDVAARYGGEELAVVLPETDTAGAGAVAERIRHAIESRRLQVAGQPLAVTVSVGVSAFRAASAQRCTREALEGLARRLVERTDQALYAAKQSGRNRVVLRDAIQAIDGADVAPA
jgi:diguanylate cyclase (GGDEF)-like protein